jgi:hypothetical protein
MVYVLISTMPQALPCLIDDSHTPSVRRGEPNAFADDSEFQGISMRPTVGRACHYRAQWRWFLNPEQHRDKENPPATMDG